MTMSKKKSLHRPIYCMYNIAFGTKYGQIKLHYI